MSERTVHKVELEDIVVPKLDEGGSAIIFQRHGKYSRDRTAPDAGSISPESTAQMAEHDRRFFHELLQQEDVYVLFVSSDTQYAGNGHRSLETAQVAQDAAIEEMVDIDIDPKERIINFSDSFVTARHDGTDQDIRPLAGIREPQIFNPEDRAYLAHLQENYGYADEEAKTGLTPKGWAMHEMDAEREMRETTGAEGENELIARTKRTLAVLERYARIWHTEHPGKRLVIWAASHYDTISPIIKEADGVLRMEDGSLSDAYQPVDYGGGVVINLPPSAEDEATLERRTGSVPIEMGSVATKVAVTRQNSPKY